MNCTIALIKSFHEIGVSFMLVLFQASLTSRNILAVALRA